MQDYIKKMIGKLEEIATNFIISENGTNYIKQQMTELVKVGPNLPFDFDYLLVAICRNGGLIGICKKDPSYFDMNKTKIDKNILVMFQDTKKRFYIPIDWEYSKSYIVSLEFNEKEQLYGFCNDGSLYKMDILRQKAVKQINSTIFLDEGIVKAKMFEKGFIALTTKGSIYYVPEIKNPKPIFVVNITEQLKFSNNVDFLGISPRYSKSNKFELLLINEKGNGLLNIELQDSGDEPYKKGANLKKEVKISILLGDTLEDFNPNSQSSGKEVLGKVKAICMSPSKKEFAVYCSENSNVYILPTKLNKIKYTKLKYDLEKVRDLENEQLNEIKALLSFNNNNYQFLFCGKDAVVLCGQRSILLLNKKNEILNFNVTEDSSIKAITGQAIFKCITEIDGIRFFSKDGVFLISEVDPDLVDICSPFSKSVIKNLINAYGLYLSKNADCDKLIRDKAMELPNAINSLQNAAMNIFFTEKDNDYKDLQMFLLKASQYGKSFVQKGDFNYDKYIQNSKDMRIVNTWRNLKDTPRYVTFKEYKDGLNPDSPEFIKIVLRHHNYSFAFELCNFLGFENDIIYQRFCVACIKQFDNDIEAGRRFKDLNRKLSECQNVSYINLAKKCIKNLKYNLAERFLEQEKSIVVKVPQYLQLKNWGKALKLAIESNDRTVIKVVIDKIFKVENNYGNDNFIKIVQGEKKVHKAVIEYLRLHDKDELLKKYLLTIGDYEELLYMTLEKFFKCKKANERKSYLVESRGYINKIKGSPNIDFYISYIKDLENSLKFKKDCIDKAGIIQSSDISPFDNSIFECYKLGVETKYDFIESENKKFNIGQKKISYIRFKNLAEKQKFAEIEDIIKKTSFKKLEISPLIVAKILINNQGYESAKNIIINDVVDLNDFPEKINLLKKMKMHKEALDVVMNDKRVDKQMYIEDILRENPTLRSYLEKLPLKK